MLGIKSRYKNHISPALGKYKIVEIERRNIKNLQQSLLKSQKASSVNVIIGLVCDILNGAVEDNIIAKNPAARIKAARDENTKAVDTFHRALTEDEQNLFIEEAKSEWLYEMLGLMLCTGIRVGEAAALLWSDLDYKNNVIHITKTITRTAEGKYIEGPPKSKTGIRDIPMTDVVKDVLRSQKIKQTTVFGNVVSISQRVFTGISGSIVYNAVANSAITRTLKRLEEKGYKIEHFSCHALRDSFATRYIENGGTPQTLKTIMGHSSLAMTMDLYAHVLPNTKQKEMDNISDAFKIVMR
jgi:integrase